MSQISFMQKLSRVENEKELHDVVSKLQVFRKKENSNCYYIVENIGNDFVKKVRTKIKSDIMGFLCPQKYCEKCGMENLCSWLFFLFFF
jgi:hypothetical protein